MTVEQKKKRGRPRKVKEVVSVSAGDDLIAQLLTQATVNSPSAENVSNDSDISSITKSQDESDGEAHEVQLFKFEGRTYLRGEDNVSI